MNADVLLRSGFLIAMGTVSVSLWTIRVALTGRGRRLAASAIAGIEAVVFVLVFASVLSSLSSPVEVGGYAVGVAAGTLLGVVADARLSTGQSAVRIVVDGTGDDLVLELRARAWPATRLQGDGVKGGIALMLLVVDDVHLPRLVADLHRLAPEAFWAVERLQSAKPAVLPAEYRQFGPRRRRAAATTA